MSELSAKCVPSDPSAVMLPQGGGDRNLRGGEQEHTLFKDLNGGIKLTCLRLLAENSF